MADADASARKVARILFHLLMENPSFTKKMNQMKDELDQNVLKHLQLDGPANIDLSSLRNLSAALKASEQTIALLKQELITAIPYDASLGNEFELDDIMQFDDEPVKKVSSSRPKFPERRMSMSGAQRLMPGATLPSKDPSDSAESKLGKPSSL